MRVLVLLLVLANAGYFAWSRWIAPAAAGGPVAATPNVPRLVLGREAGDPPITPLPASGCVSIGPFVDASDAARGSTSLRALGMAPRQRSAEGSVWTGYWVSLAGLATREDADGVVARLRQFGITDAYVLDGEPPLVVSLGLFSEEQRALRRLDEVKAQGYAATVAPRERPGSVYWLDVDIPEGAPAVDTSVFQAASGRILRLEVRACPGAAAPAAPPAAADGDTAAPAAG